MKQLERLLFLQGNRCFFCQELIPAGEGSVEHLVATSNGGNKDDENCVACCKTVNAALGSLSIKSKLQVVLNHRGSFACPSPLRAEPHAVTRTELPQAADERLALVIADLHKRGTSRPGRIATLKNTMNAVFQMQLTDEELVIHVNALESIGYITVQDTKVTYALPPQLT